MFLNKNNINSNNTISTTYYLDNLISYTLGLFSIWTVACQTAVFVSLSLINAFYLFSVLLFVAVFSLIIAIKKSVAERCDQNIYTKLDIAELLNKLTTRQFSIILLLILSAAASLLDYRITTILIIVIYIFIFKKSNLEGTSIFENKTYYVDDSKKSLFLLGSLATLFAILAIIVHRPDLDDSYHLNVALNSQLYPHAVVSSITTIMYNEPKEFWLPFVWRIQTLHQLLGLIGYFTNINPVYFCHLIIPPLAAIFVVLAQYRLFVALACKNALLLTIFSLLVIFVSGNTNISIGNFGGFVRLHHGNGIFLTAMIPLIAAYSLQAYKSPSSRNLILLAIIQISSVGLTSTAILLAPLVTIFTLLTQFTFSTANIKKSLICILISAYPIILGGATYLLSSDASGSTAFQSYEMVRFNTIEQSLLNVLGPLPISALILFFILTSWLGTSSKAAFKYCLMTLFLCGLVILNPLAVKLWCPFLIPENVYYRMLWLLHIPTLCSFAMLVPYKLFKANLFNQFSFYSAVVSILVLAAHCMSFFPIYKIYTGGYQSIFHYILVFFLLVIAAASLKKETRYNHSSKVLYLTFILFGFIFPGRFMLNSNNAIYGAKLEVKTPQLKVQQEDYRIAKHMNQIAQEQTTMIAPEPVAAWITTLPNNKHPLLSRLDIVPSAVIAFGNEEVLFRLQLMDLVSGQLAVQENQIKVIMDEAMLRYPLSVICLYNNINTTRVLAYLTSNGFKITEQTPLYTVVHRSL